MKAPDFWNQRYGRAAAPLTRSLLLPFSWLYGAVSRWRYQRVLAQQIEVPVICVGNISLGGTGKTPVALTIGKTLLAQGLPIAFLSRGYGGKEPGPLRVVPEQHSFADVGDEPLLLAQLAATYIGRDRVASAKMAIQAGAKCLIMDDGFQNPGLAKDLSILVVDSDVGHGNGRVFPAGPLREKVANAVARADAVVLVGDNKSPDLAGFSGPVLRANLQSTAKPPQTKLVAFAGIGRPERFFDSLRQQGCELEQEIAFADHHPYSPRDLQNLLAYKQQGAQLITTEKDQARLPVDFRQHVHIWPVAMDFEKPDDLVQVLRAHILQKVMN
ncbi:Tetraacyldisaccharide 4'-kinase [hydrothermal vent metagenome]|uniref:tetraacyldisaccharide 4'-kinase n=1 Tax=hydrothermal vent metagenome TaxID=652676 RepID=A0A3B0RDV2_9ZZZZ